MAQRSAVLANGRIVEIAPREVLFRNPVHSYTRALLKAVPFPDLDHPLDLSAVAKRGASDPKNWAPQFRDDGDPASLTPIDLGHGHSVLARATADQADLVA
jgi:peptide/nickel transport system ATP-binding protein